MDRELLKTVIADQAEYKLPRTFFDRSQSEVIRSYLDDPNIMIVTGIRRSGKSTILRVLQQEQPESDYYFNFDDERLIQFAVDDFQMLLEMFIEIYGKQKTYYFDEIQNVEGWERFVRRLYEQGNKIFITGSNARLLSRELGTHLTGRNIQLEVYPLSFKEIVFHEDPALIEKKVYSTSDKGLLLNLFSLYTIHGGIPEYFKFRKEEYLKSLYEGILYRDIIVRHNITNEKALRELVYYFASNVGKEFSYRNLSEYLGLGSSNTVSAYCGYLEECYLCFFLTRYSHSLKKQMLYQKKCYMIDPALIRVIGFRVSQDKGRLLENLVFLNLKAQGKDLFFHKRVKECDFIVREGNRVVGAFQVALSLTDTRTRQREIDGLVEAMEDYGLAEGWIITENESENIKYANFSINVVPAWRFFLG